MTKTILITGATDGIGRETARRLASEGLTLLVHGRNSAKLAETAEELRRIPGAGPVETFRADLSSLAEVVGLARAVRLSAPRLDVLINNAGVLRTDSPRTPQGLDVRFVVNTLAPALLTRLLLPTLAKDGRIVHLSSAAQATVDVEALAGHRRLEAMQAYAQSKLALTMWSQALSDELPEGQVTVTVNPGSLLGTKMVRRGFGVSGNDIGIGAGILYRAALSEQFANGSGRYYDNDSGRFAAPHVDTTVPEKCVRVCVQIETLIGAYLEKTRVA